VIVRSVLAALAGVSVDAIADDYAITAVQLAEMLAPRRLTQRNTGWTTCASSAFHSAREAMVRRWNASI